VEEGEVEILTAEEIAVVLKGLDGHELAPMVHLDLATGLRRDRCQFGFRGAPAHAKSLILQRGATWRSGYATVCKTVYPGSIPGVASST
jgi:hypothetical protein